MLTMMVLVCCLQCSPAGDMDAVSNGECSRLMRPTLTLDLEVRAADQLSDVVLSSPDVGLLKLASPELEKLVLQQYNYYHHHQQQQLQQLEDTSRLTLDRATTEQYARGFVDALLELHAQRQTDCDSAVGPRTSAASLKTAAARSSVVCAAQRHTGFSQAVAAGPGTSGSDHVTFSDTPPTSPIDLARDADDERARLERKRARNRLAATRCRNRKLERIDQLQNQADRLRAANAKLASEVKQLREIVSKLRQDVLLHSDCQLAVTLPPRTSVFDSSV